MSCCCRWMALFLLLGLAGTASAAPRSDRCVILVSVDGLAGFYLDDPKADLPTLRNMARNGARASGMVCSFPTVTWPNHTTLVTGVPPRLHGVIGNNYFDRTFGKSVPLIPDPLFDKEEIVKSPTIYDVAHQAGLKTAGIIWPASRNAKTLDWTVPDMAGDGWQRFGTQSWLTELRGEGLPVDMQPDWVKVSTGGVQRDWLYVRLARNLVQKHNPNLILIHLVETDHVQHRVGPRAPDAYWAVSYADDRLRDLVDFVQASPLRDRTTFFICSDHGFFPIDKEIRPNVLLRQLGLRGEKAGQGKQAAFCLSQGGACAVYVLDRERHQQIVAQLADQLAHLEGVEQVFLPKDFGRLGQPTPDEDPHGADMWLSAKKGYSFSESASGEQAVTPRESRAGTHGYLPENQDLLGTCVMWGAGIKPGVNLAQVQNIDVAPTMAAVLGLEMPSAKGQAMRAALADE